MWNTITILILVTVKSSGNYSFSLSKNILTKIIDIAEMRHILGIYFHIRILWMLWIKIPFFEEHYIDKKYIYIMVSLKLKMIWPYYTIRKINTYDLLHVLQAFYFSMDNLNPSCNANWEWFVLWRYFLVTILFGCTLCCISF